MAFLKSLFPSGKVAVEASDIFLAKGHTAGTVVTYGYDATGQVTEARDKIRKGAHGYELYTVMINKSTGTIVGDKEGYKVTLQGFQTVQQGGRTRKRLRRTRSVRLR
jgi:YD repeat-containing protein